MMRFWLVLCVAAALAACATGGTTVKVSGYTTASAVAHVH